MDYMPPLVVERFFCTASLGRLVKTKNERREERRRREERVFPHFLVDPDFSFVRSANPSKLT